MYFSSPYRYTYVPVREILLHSYCIICLFIRSLVLVCLFVCLLDFLSSPFFSFSFLQQQQTAAASSSSTVVVRIQIRGHTGSSLLAPAHCGTCLLFCLEEGSNCLFAFFSLVDPRRKRVGWPRPFTTPSRKYAFRFRHPSVPSHSCSRCRGTLTAVQYAIRVTLRT